MKVPAREPEISTVEPEAPPQTDLSVLIHELRGEFDTLRVENARQKSEIEELTGELERTRQLFPSFKAIEQRDDPAVERRRIFETHLQPNEVVSGGFTLPVTFDGHLLPNHPGYKGRFQPGQQVRINPDVTREGASDPWRTTLTRIPNAAPIGIVRKTLWFAKTGQWKYKVYFKNLTGRAGDGFHEYELLPA